MTHAEKMMKMLADLQVAYDSGKTDTVTIAKDSEGLHAEKIFSEEIGKDVHVLFEKPDDEIRGACFYIEHESNPHVRTFELNYVVGEQWRGKGVTKRLSLAATFVLCYLCEMDDVKTVQIFSVVHPENSAALKIAEHIFSGNKRQSEDKDGNPQVVFSVIYDCAKMREVVKTLIDEHQS